MLHVWIKTKISIGKKHRGRKREQFGIAIQTDKTSNISVQEKRVKILVSPTFLVLACFGLIMVSVLLFSKKAYFYTLPPQITFSVKYKNK